MDDLDMLVADLRAAAAGIDDDIAIYIGQMPANQVRWISAALSASPELLTGYGTVAYQYTTVTITIRHENYRNVVDLQNNVILALNRRPKYTLLGINPPQTVRAGESPAIDAIEISMTIEILTKLS